MKIVVFGTGFVGGALVREFAGLERDGILTRTSYDVVPPQVSYQLTALGVSLLRAATPLIDWSAGHVPEIAAARADYDRNVSPLS
ncbi:winged helix-turn-helix transcriptional regulator [Dactylosporangium sp. CA-092794]|uniref:winged helix-turn-helix transcriptional regulator n=1 Tax=Dactylosporangium sp. CA-092794 TaxID=3239929 RepID=UPI003D9451D5